VRTARLAQRDAGVLEAVAEACAHLADLGFHYRRGDEAGDQPVLLFYAPPARMNPYQGLLYCRAFEHGVAPLPMKDWSGLAEVPWPGRMVCHFHWVGDVLAGAASDQEADDRVAAFAELLATLRAQGRRIVWTAHNILPHDTQRPEHDAAVRRALVEAADAVHVMAPGTAGLLAEVVELSGAKALFVPHASYAGAYPDYVSRASARSELGLEGEDFAFLLFGALQRYKGVDELVAAFDRLLAGSPPRPVKLIVAGQASEGEWARRLRLWATGTDAAVVEPSRIPLEDVQYYYRAADLAVLPYRRALNSGAAMLALTFGVPFLAPCLDGLKPLVDRFGCPSYDPADGGALHRAMAEALTADLGAVRSRIRAGIGELAPAAVSDRFFGELLGRLGWDRSRELAGARS
jgi:beta-1,4-mannosyltransferase